MRIIDLESFPRRSHFEFFKSYAYPYVGITANVDVTNLYDSAKAKGGSPFLAFLWAAATAANSASTPSPHKVRTHSRFFAAADPPGL